MKEEHTEMDALQTAWQRQNEKVNRLLALNTKLLNEASLRWPRTSLHRLSWMLAFEIAATLVAMVALGSFTRGHLGNVKFVAPAVALDLYALFVLQGAVRQLITAKSIRYSAPLVQIQRQIERLDMLRIRTTQLTLLVAPLAWAPLFIVALSAMGIDAYKVLGVPYVLANVGLGIAVILVGRWIARRYTGTPLGEKLNALFDDHDLRDASRFLATLDEFEQGTDTAT